MVKPRGLLLMNDKMPEVPGGSMRLAGTTIVKYNASAVEAAGCTSDTNRSGAGTPGWANGTGTVSNQR
jgi:hypothetical protein